MGVGYGNVLAAVWVEVEKYGEAGEYVFFEDVVVRAC